MKNNLLKLSVLVLALIILSAAGLFEWYVVLILLLLGAIVFILKEGDIFMYLGIALIFLIPLLLIFDRSWALVAGNLAFLMLVIYAVVRLINNDAKT